mgnify:CR=1 FL=1
MLGWLAVGGSVLAAGKGLPALIDAQFHPDPALLSAIRRCCVVLAAVAGYWLFVRWHEQRQPTELRLRPLALVLGGASGAAMAALPIALLFAIGAYQLVQFRGVSPALPGVAVLIAIAATLEELAYRCVLFQVVERYWGSAVALAIQAVAFAAMHVANLSNGSAFDIAALLVNVAFGGLFWAGVFLLTRNLWAVAANHAAWNFTILLSGLPLSGIEDWRGLAPMESRMAGPDWLTGGMFGPESSLLLIVVTIAATAWLLQLAHRRGAFRNARHPGSRTA